MPVAHADLAHVAPGQTVQAIHRRPISSCALQQLVKGSPVVLPVEVVANPLSQFLLVDFVAQPLVENVLIAGEHRLNCQDHGTLTQRRPGRH